MTTHSQTPVTDTVVQFVAVPFDRDTYKRLLYLLLACPLALAYVVGTTTGLSLGIGLSVILIGLPILLVTLLAVTSAAWFEAYLSRVCLDRDSSTPVALTRLRMDLDDPHIEYVTAIKRFLADPSTWTSLGVVTVKSVFGVMAFVALTTLATTVAALVAAPLLYDNPEYVYEVATYSVDTLPVALGLSVIGILVGLGGLHLLNAVADFGGYLTESLLSVGQPLEE